MLTKDNHSILNRLPLEVWKIVFNEFSAKELWKTCSTNRYWSYLIVNTLVSRLKKKPLDICSIPFSSSCMNFSYDDYLIHIKQPQPIILGQWVSRSVGFVPWCQQESNNNKKNTQVLQNYANKNNLKYYAENPPTLYCWFCSPYNVDKEITELGNVSSMYDLPKAENGLLSNKNRYYNTSYNYNYNNYYGYNQSYSMDRNYYNPSSHSVLPSSRSSVYDNRTSYGFYQNNTYGRNTDRSSIYTNSSYYRTRGNGYEDENDLKNIKKSKTDDNNNGRLDIYEISIGNGMAKLKYELVNIEENTSGYSQQQSYNGSNNSNNNDYRRNSYPSSPSKNSSKCIEGNSKMSINDFLGGINKSFDVVSSKNPQGNYSNLIMDYYNPNLVIYDNMSPNPRNSNPYNSISSKSDTVIEVKIIELILHPSAIFS
ncbi:hypothetical protein PIROE2DRAFT_7271 [Piromyces sp. E2]|nr:hypothetical protein PIROE2DRAFT_7271 [Piromyces sp. E2]|eukprot:OUM65686.1 hypothetical protein PIROE2DRAFT_7271 [Piromyces sp. E2]